MLILAEQRRKQRIEVLSFSPVGDALLTAGNGSWLNVWRLDTPTEPQCFFETTDPREQVFDAQFWDCGNTVVAACGSRGLQIQPLTATATSIAASHESIGFLIELAVSPRD